MTILKWTPTGGEDYYAQMQWDGITISGNVFGHTANGGEGAQLVQWDVPVEGSPDEVFNRHNELKGEIKDGGLISLSFSGTYDPNNCFTIRNYSNFVLGSNAGYFQTWGMSTNTLKKLPGVWRGGAGGKGPNEAFDMTPARDAIGFPCMIGDMPQTTVHVTWSETGPGGNYNIFGDMYLHDVSNESLLPTDSKNGGKPQTQFKDTINGISQNDTKMWNPNWWFNLPCGWKEHDPLVGDLITTVEVESGKPIDVYANRLGFSGNNCVFLSFVFKSPTQAFDMDISAYVNWMKSTATGAGTFLTDIYETDIIRKIAAEMANPPEVGGVTPLPRTLRAPDDMMAIDGYQQGSECWGANPKGSVAKISYSRLGFTVDGQTFGYVPDGQAAQSAPAKEVTAATAAPQKGKTDEGKDKTEAKANPCAGCDGDDSGVVLKAGKEKLVPGSNGYEGSYTFDDSAIATISNQWKKGVGKCLCVTGLKAGETTLRWGDGNSVKVTVK